MLENLQATQPQNTDAKHINHQRTLLHIFSELTIQFELSTYIIKTFALLSPAYTKIAKLFISSVGKAKNVII